MNREIRFRFWDSTNKIMSTDSDGWSDHIGINEMFTELVEQFDIIPMQFTGLKDKNGKEIYEGDIVRGTYSKLINYMRQRSIDVKGIVEFNNAQFAIFTRLTNAGVKEYKFFNQFWPLSPNGFDIEIIGNIYENPELLTTNPKEERK